MRDFLSDHLADGPEDVAENHTAEQNQRTVRHPVEVHKVTHPNEHAEYQERSNDQHRRSPGGLSHPPDICSSRFVAHVHILERELIKNKAHSVARIDFTEFVGTFDLCPSVGESDIPRARARTRVRSAYIPTPLHTDSESRRRPGIHGVCKPGVSE